MGYFSVLLLALAATADSFIIGLNYGVKQVHITNLSNLFISLLCFLGTLVAMIIGRLLGSVVSNDFAQILGSAALLGFGAYMLLQAISPSKKHRTNDPAVMDKDGSNAIELRESALIGAVLSLNNVGLGIGAGIAGVSVLLTPILCAFASFVLIHWGCRCGGYLNQSKLAGILELFSALLVLALGGIGFF